MFFFCKLRLKQIHEIDPGGYLKFYSTITPTLLTVQQKEQDIEI
jgi:hypothetical protein